MATASNDLGTIIRGIKTVMNVPFTVMRDVKVRLSSMPRVTSMQIMYESATTVCQLIEAISKKESYGRHHSRCATNDD